jgi:hypothetical protein
MAGLVPAIHDFDAISTASREWSAMTGEERSPEPNLSLDLSYLIRMGVGLIIF